MQVLTPICNSDKTRRGMRKCAAGLRLMRRGAQGHAP